MSGEYFLRPPRSAYLHIPFCYRRCFYCDFPIEPIGDDKLLLDHSSGGTIQTYLNYLIKEISASPSGEALSTVYIGGGTPSLLNAKEIGSLLNKLRSHFGFQDGAEITLEMDPASFNLEDLKGYLNVGINRVSLGAQSFDDNVLRNIGRKHNCFELLEACEWINDFYKKGEISSWSIDLIQNLPSQTIEDWHKQLSNAISIGSPHLSIYDLSIEPGTAFDLLNRRGNLPLPDEDVSADISLLTSQKLKKAGFSRYEISNYAFPGHASRHNRTYWDGSGWWGFGMGATSSPWGERFARPKIKKEYFEWVESQLSRLIEPSLIKKSAKPMGLDELILIGLRRREGIDLLYLANRWGWTINQCNEYFPFLQIRWQESIERGLLKRRGMKFQLSDPEGMELSNQVFVQLFLWWDSLPDSAVD